jgi:alpha-glucosidase
MQRHLAFGLGCLSLITCASATAAGEKASLTSVVVTSPDARVAIEVFVDGVRAARHPLLYRVTFRSRPVLEDSPLGVDLADGTTLGGDCEIEGSKTEAINNSYRQYPGKRSVVVDRCNETMIQVRERGTPRRVWQLLVRASDDGIALRYRFPKQDGWSSLFLRDERTNFTFPEETECFALPLNAFTTSYEKRYVKRAVKELPGDWLLGLPLLVEMPGAGWAAITEANLTDYAGMYLAHEIGRKGTLTSRLSPRPGEPGVAVRASLPHDSPWRVIMVADHVGKLIESDLLLNLNSPRAIEDLSWILPGKTTFPWWNGYFEQNVPFEPGLNTRTIKHYIDFCAEVGIPYHSLDGKGNTAWYGGPIVPYKGADPTRAIEGLDLAEVLRYARTKGVRLRVWIHWQAAKAHMARAFPLYREWGVEGVMIDFMDRDDQEMVNFLRELVQLATANRLTVTLHGVSKPTGLERTYPNLLTSEGVMNLEYDKWDPVGIPPEHEVTVPFTRMLAGPLDFHQGSFRTVPVAQFKPRNEAPQIMGTPCRTLASYVVFQNHLPMVVDYPSAYRGHPALGVLASIPATWDDTRVLSGVVGEQVVIARRHGGDWWIGAMTDREPRYLSISLDFLGAGRFRAEIYRDDAIAPYKLAKESRGVEAGDVVGVRLAPAGGLLIHVSPQPP